MKILVDMDGVLADLGFFDRWQARYPEKKAMPLGTRAKFFIRHEYPRQDRALVMEIMREPGFFRDFEPIPGAVKALGEMKRIGWKVFICTSPLIGNATCATEKYEWVSQFLGKSWEHRVILTQDKTLIRGNILIDDRPEIKGVYKPTWKHVVYDQSYNRGVKGKRRLTWANWREVLG